MISHHLKPLGVFLWLGLCFTSYAPTGLMSGADGWMDRRRDGGMEKGLADTNLATLRQLKNTVQGSMNKTGLINELTAQDGW